MAPPDADAFHAFSRLPPELRCKIWRLTAFPRILTIRQRLWMKGERNPKFVDDDYFFLCDTVPAVLHTCHDARKWAPYVRAFRDVRVLQDKGVESPRYIWVNFQLDTLRFVDEAIYLSKLGDQDSASIQHIVLHVNEIHQFFQETIDDLDRMNNLKSLQIHVARGGLKWWSRQVGYLENQFKRWFGGRDDGWVCPDFRLIDLESGFELNRENHLTRRELVPRPSPRTPPSTPRGRGRGGRGCRGSRGGRIARGV